MINTKINGKKLFSRAISIYNQRNYQKYSAGYQLLIEAANIGFVMAHEWLGAIYDYGLGVKSNQKKSFYHYMIGAKADNANCQYHVGIF